MQVRKKNRFDTISVLFHAYYLIHLNDFSIVINIEAEGQVLKLENINRRSQSICGFDNYLISPPGGEMYLLIRESLKSVRQRRLFSQKI